MTPSAYSCAACGESLHHLPRGWLARLWHVTLVTLLQWLERVLPRFTPYNPRYECPEYAAASPDKLAQNVARCERGPVTRAWLADDLAALGLRPGMLLMVHASISALGFLTSPEGLIPTLRDAVGPGGTLVLPAFSWQNSDPSLWQKPPVPESWWQLIRDEAPAFDPQTFICEPSIGHLPEMFRCQPGVLRSAHPTVSWCAQGPLAEAVTGNHQLSLGLDENSPLGKVWELDGWVLSLGCRRTTILHLAESRSAWAQRHLRMSGSKMLVDGLPQWVAYPTVHDTDKDFEQCRLAYLAQADPADAFEGPTGYGQSRLLRARPLIEFATDWFNRNRLD